MQNFELIPRALPDTDITTAERALGFMPLRVKIYKIFSGLSLALVSLALLLYPVWPAVNYYLNYQGGATSYAPHPVAEASANDAKEEEGSAPAVLGVDAPEHKDNTLIIPKIGVEMNITGGSNSEYAWNRGAWIDPDTSTPERGGNSVISAHRFKYIPPHKETFYLLDKLKEGDEFRVYWEGKEYVYRVDDIKTVSPFDVSILEPTDDSVVTLYTCAPLFSTKERLVVRGIRLE